jgi:predicted NAD-dependent protein-ADP-ribosyltransferase YbiA (DUF1768 family)
MSKPEVIKFYTTKGPFPCGTNFSRHPMLIDGRVWPTNEHYYQAMKFHPLSVINIDKNTYLAHIDLDPLKSAIINGVDTYTVSLQEWIRVQHGPGAAAKEGRRRDLPMRTDWDDVKDDFMFNGLCHKFAQHPDILQELINTGDAILVEYSKIDYYWGCGKSGNGKNMLGKQLMKLRDLAISRGIYEFTIR